jgi:hypothetical protein
MKLMNRETEKIEEKKGTKSLPRGTVHRYKIQLYYKEMTRNCMMNTYWTTLDLSDQNLSIPIKPMVVMRIVRCKNHQYKPLPA